MPRIAKKRLLQQAEALAAEGRYQEIQDLLKPFPSKSRGYELNLMLVRALNRQAWQDFDRLMEEGPYERSYPPYELLRSLEDEAAEKEDTRWDCEMVMTRVCDADIMSGTTRLSDLQKGESTAEMEWMQEEFRRVLDCPVSGKPFVVRAEECWDRFLQKEARLREVLDGMSQEPNVETQGWRDLEEEEINIILESIGKIILDLSYGWKKSEDGTWTIHFDSFHERADLLIAVQLMKSIPESVKGRWNILIGDQPCKDLETYWGEVYSEEDLATPVCVNRFDENRVEVLASYSRYLPPEMADKHIIFVIGLLQVMLGDIGYWSRIARVEYCEKPGENFFPISELPDVLHKMGMDPTLDLNKCLDNSMEEIYCEEIYPLDLYADTHFRPRGDIYYIRTCFRELHEEYRHAEGSNMDLLFQMGAPAGFLYYPLQSMNIDGRIEECQKLQEFLEEKILQKVGNGAVTFLGFATGYHYGYLDFIAWDLKHVLEAAKSALEEAPVSWGRYHTFWPTTEPVLLAGGDEDRMD